MCSLILYSALIISTQWFSSAPIREVWLLRVSLMFCSPFRALQ